MEQETENTALTQPEPPAKSWAASVSDCEKEPPRKKNFFERLAPESKRGRVIFAAASAQVASMLIAPGLWGITQSAMPKQLQKLTDHFAGIFDKKPEMMSGMLHSRIWEGFFDPEEQEQWQAAKANSNPAARHQMQAAKLISMGIQGIYNIGSTMWVRDSLDKKLHIGAGTGQVAKTQFLDTIVSIGALFAIPRFIPDTSIKWRRGVREATKPIIRPILKLATDGKVSEERVTMAAKGFAFYSVNMGIPDMLGFLTGLGSMMNAVELKEKKAELEKVQQQQGGKGLGV